MIWATGVGATQQIAGLIGGRLRGMNSPEAPVFICGDSPL